VALVSLASCGVFRKKGVLLMSTVNPIVWKRDAESLELMPYLMFAPHCENCGKPVEAFEGVPVGCIYPHQMFLCTECEDLDRGYFLYMVHQVESGAWTEEQAEVFMMSLYDDDGPYS
jgi:hypothetical protein